MKKCPKCNIFFEEDEFEGCPNCGTDLLPFVPSESDVRPSSKAGDNIVFDLGRPLENSLHEPTNITELGKEHLSDNHSASVGDNNTFTGGVHDDHSKTSSDNITKTNSENQSNSNNTTNSHNTTTTTTYNTTINEAQKSKSDLLEEDKLKYLLQCKKFYKNGFISKNDEEYLSSLQDQLGLADEIVIPIKQKIQQKSRTPSQKLSQTVIDSIKNTRTIIELNLSDAIWRQKKQLESWMQVYDDESLKSWYYQLSSILDPVHFTVFYEESDKDEYWNRYWAHVAFMLQNKEEQAYEASACLGILQANYPDQNELLLRLLGKLIQNESIESIKNEFNPGAIYCSKELLLLLETIDELLHKKWSRLWDIIPGTLQVRRSGEPIVRPVHSFYANTLFKSFVDTQIEVGKKQREEEERISRAERERQEEIIRQKGYLLQKFQEVEDIKKTCEELGIPYLTFQNWKEEDLTFNSNYNAIVRNIEDKRNEEAERIRIAKEKEAEVARQKSHFKFLYEQNNCDLIKTCTETGVNSDSIRCWRESDRAFDDALSFIERENAKKLQVIFLQCYEANNCDVQKACAEMDISEGLVNKWRDSNKAFDASIISIKRKHVKQLQAAFARCYEANECDLLKTCSESGVDSSTYREWRNSDQAFADKIDSIENEQKNKLESQRRKKRKDWFLKKGLPVLLIAILLVVIYCIGKPIIQQQIDKKNAEEAALLQEQKLIDSHNQLLRLFDEAVSEVRLDDTGADAIERLELILNDIKVFENEHSSLNGIEPKYTALKGKVDELCSNLIEFYQRKSTPLELDPVKNADISERYRALKERVNNVKTRI